MNIFYRFTLKLIATLSWCAVIPLHADAWDNFVRIAHIVTKDGKSTELPSGVAREKEFKENIEGLPNWNRELIENITLSLEEESREAYLLANVGTPFIGVVNLNTGVIYLHPTVLTYQLQLVDRNVASFYDNENIFIIDNDIFKTLPSMMRNANNIGKTAVLTPQKYSGNQLPPILFQSTNIESFNKDKMNSKPILSKYGGYSLLPHIQHKGSNDDKYKQFVYHSRNDAYVLPEERRLISWDCHPDNEKTESSHGCLVKMLDEVGEPHLGFAVTKHDEEFCSKEPNLRIGEVNGLFFTGTSASQNNHVYKVENGAIAEREARKIYNELVQSLQIDADSIKPCSGTFDIERDLPEQKYFEEGEPFTLSFKIAAVGQAKENFMNKGYECTWFKDDKIFSQNDCQIFIDNADHSVAGLYRVEARPRGSDIIIKSAVSHVTEEPLPPLPEFTDKKEGKTLFLLEKNQAITITANTKHATKFLWQKSKDKKWVNRGRDRNLHIAEFDEDLHAGTYRVIASNRTGTIVKEIVLQGK